MVYMTFPKNATAPGTALAKLLETETELEYAVVGQEAHKDGHPHLHVFAKFKKRVRYSLSHFDYVAGGKHGNYQAVKFPRECLRYCIKDGNYVAHGCEPKALLEKLKKKKKEKLSDLVAQSIRQGATDAELVDTYPGYVLLQGHRIASFRTLLTSLSGTGDASASGCKVTLKNATGACVASWSLDSRSQMPFRHPALWICGPTKTGKSTVLNTLSESSRGFQLPFNGDFQYWRDNSYDYAYCDEFHGQLTVTFLNEWIQGTPMHLNTKGSSYQKKHNLPTIILSNYTPAECFPKARNLDTLIGRLEILEVPSGSYAMDFLSIELRPAPQAQAASPTTTQVIVIEDE